MKMVLTQKIVLQDLRIDQRPREDGKGGWTWEPNPQRTPYYVSDAHQKAPIGFAVKVGATKKTYIIQRRVPGTAAQGARNVIVKEKVGNVSDFPSLDHAREAARDLAKGIVTKGRARMASHKDGAHQPHTLGDVLDRYLAHLTSRRRRPIAANTVRNLGQAIKRLQDWSDRPLAEIRSDEVKAKFEELAQRTPTAAEQTFQWASRAVRRAIEQEKRSAHEEGRPTVLSYNPFAALKEDGFYRTRADLERDINAKGVRRPLDELSIAVWFDEISRVRDYDKTGADFLILTTLWGARKEESASVAWRDSLTDEEARTCSYVDLERREVFFYKTKNTMDLLLPLADGAREVLIQRRALAEQAPNDRAKRWVFPAKSKFSKTGRYSDMTSLMDGICKRGGINPIRPHDMRRTFGRFAERLVSATTLKQLLNHRELSDTTRRYTEQEWHALCEGMQKIELVMLAHSPRLYNALLVPGRAPLPERPEPR